MLIEYIEKCAWEYVDDFTAVLADLHMHYKNGFLLEHGGIADQSAWYTEAMLAMERAMNGETNKKHKKMISESKSKR